VTQGDTAEAARVLGRFDRYDPERAVVVPPATLVQGHILGSSRPRLDGGGTSRSVQAQLNSRAGTVFDR